MTPSEAKRIIKSELEKRGLPFTRLSAKTIGFSDLAGGECIFVHVHGWQPNPIWGELETLAQQNGFRIEA
jgi:hypothetical protein